jgi:hypothetical protein
MAMQSIPSPLRNLYCDVLMCVPMECVCVCVCVCVWGGGATPPIACVLLVYKRSVQRDGDECEDGGLLGSSFMLSGGSLPTFQRPVLPPSSLWWVRIRYSSPWWWRQYGPLKRWQTSTIRHGTATHIGNWNLRNRLRITTIQKQTGELQLKKSNSRSPKPQVSYWNFEILWTSAYAMLSWYGQNG